MVFQRLESHDKPFPSYLPYPEIRTDDYMKSDWVDFHKGDSSHLIQPDLNIAHQM